MKEVLKSLTVVLLIFSLIHCGKDDENVVNLTTDLIPAVRALDIDNTGNASDLLIVFALNDINGVQEIRAVLVPSSDIAAFNSGVAQSLETGSFHKINVSGKSYKVRLPAGIKDSNGADVQQNTEYTLAIVLQMNGDFFLNTNTAKIRFTDRHPLEGKYIGSWDDNLYTDFGISAELTFSQNRLSGPFYYSASFTACCGGSDDGSIAITLDGNTITLFRYVQSLDSFMGGACDGLYSGDGMVENLTSLSINFTGEDCEGAHTGGKIVLERIE